MEVIIQCLLTDLKSILKKVLIRELSGKMRYWHQNKWRPCSLGYKWEGTQQMTSVQCVGVHPRVPPCAVLYRWVQEANKAIQVFPQRRVGKVRRPALFSWLLLLCDLEGDYVSTCLGFMYKKHENLVWPAVLRAVWSLYSFALSIKPWCVRYIPPC